MINRYLDICLLCIACSMLIACGDTSTQSNEADTCIDSTCDIVDESENSQEANTDSGDESGDESGSDGSTDETESSSDSDDNSNDSENNDSNNESGDETEGSFDSDDSSNDSDSENNDNNNESESDGSSDEIEDSSDNDNSNNESEDETEQEIVKSCKRGVAYGYHSEADMNVLSSGVSWWYNWAFTPDDEVSNVYQALQVEYLPMYWGDNYDANTVAAGIPDDAQTLLGFNEPNFYSQANLSATQAASLWPSVEAIADDQDLYLVSPAVNYCGGGCYDTNPIDYLNDFFDACTDCRVDAIAIHIYVDCDESSSGLADNRAQWLINHVESYKAAFDKPLWLTEFACSGNPTTDEQKAFLEDAVDYLESESQIARYAWFAGRADNMTNVDLLGDDGELTELGEAYVNAPFNTEDCE